MKTTNLVYLSVLICFSIPCVSFAEVVADNANLSPAQQTNTDASAKLTTRLISGRGIGTIETGSTIEGSSITSSSGLAFSSLHFRLESEYPLNKDLNVGLKTRLQLDNDISVSGVLGGGYLHWLSSNDDSHRWGLRLGAGYGEIAHSVLFQDAASESLGNNTNSSATYGTTYAGKLYYQVGFTYAFRLSQDFSIFAASDFMHMLAYNSPPDFSSMHIDLSLGIEFTL